MAVFGFFEAGMLALALFSAINFRKLNSASFVSFLYNHVPSLPSATQNLAWNFHVVQASAPSPHIAFLSISTPLLNQEFMLSTGLPHFTLEMVKGICPDVVEIIEPPKDGFQLTLRINFSRISRKKDARKTIASISSVQGVILSSQLKDMLMNVNSLEVSQGMYRPIKLIYHPREPFFVIKQPEKITAVFPMRFKEDTDVIISTAFFQELMDIGSSKAFDKAPRCTWSPIPPPELRGEPIKDLSTNGGFVSFGTN